MTTHPAAGAAIRELRYSVRFSLLDARDLQVFPR